MGEFLLPGEGESLRKGIEDRGQLKASEDLPQVL
jgi:hypothetical protein